MLRSPVRIAFLAALLISAGAAAAQESPLRIAVVDLDLLVSRSAAGQQLQAKLEQFEKDVQTQGEQLAATARQTRQLITDGANSLSEERLAELQKDFEDQSIAIRRFTDDKQREGQKIQNEGLKKIETQLRPIFEKIRDEGAYDLILNRAVGVVVMASTRVDITERVIELYNAAAGGTPSTGGG